MVEVIPLKYGSIFKHAFSQVDVFTQFTKDILDIDIHIDEVHTEYEYPEPIGFVKSKYDLFAEDKEKRIIVEIQQVKEYDFFDRFMYYHLIRLVEQVGGYQEYAFERNGWNLLKILWINKWMKRGILTIYCEKLSNAFNGAISALNYYLKSKMMPLGIKPKFV